MKRFFRFLFIFAVLYFVLVLSGCKETTSVISDNQTLPPIVEETEEERILLEDETGKKWDITHAVNEYGFEPNKFQFGLGPFAIRPLLEPQFLSPGQSGYPVPENTMLVIGVSINGETRAYPLSVLGNYEIADELFGDAYVAVAY